MQGVKFNDRTSKEMGVKVQVTSLPLLPEKRKNELEIPGRHGMLDFGDHTYSKRIITMDMSIVTTSRTELLTKSRAVANWLAPKGVLSIAEEPNVYYVAEIFNFVDRKRLLHSIGTFPVTFEAEPFCYMVYPDEETGEYPVINNLYDLMNSNYEKLL